MSLWVEIGELLIIIGLAYFSRHYHRKYRKLVKLIEDIYKGLQDGTLTEEELKLIIDDAKAIIDWE